MECNNCSEYEEYLQLAQKVTIEVPVMLEVKENTNNIYFDGDFTYECIGNIGGTDVDAVDAIDLSKPFYCQLCGKEYTIVDNKLIALENE